VDRRIQVRDVTVERGCGVTIVFGDGATHRYDLLALRLNCPCASCRGAREQGRAPWPRPGSPEPLDVVDAHLVGAWGLGLRWNDGHDTGIYPWDALRRWADEGEPSFAPDSGRGA
jgi:DUF971 family protein